MGIYNAAKLRAVNGALNLLGDVYCVLVKTTHVENAAHTLLSDLGTDAVGAPMPLTGKITAVTNGVAKFTADAVTFTAVPANAECNRAALYSQSSGLLIALVSVFPARTPNGGDITITWDATTGILQHS